MAYQSLARSLVSARATRLSERPRTLPSLLAAGAEAFYNDAARPSITWWRCASGEEQVRSTALRQHLPSSLDFSVVVGLPPVGDEAPDRVRHRRTESSPP